MATGSADELDGERQRTRVLRLVTAGGYLYPAFYLLDLLVV